MCGGGGGSGGRTPTGDLFPAVFFFPLEAIAFQAAQQAACKKHESGQVGEVMDTTLSTSSGRCRSAG